MIELLQTMKIGYLQVVGDGQYVACALVALFVLATYKGKKRVELERYSFLILLLLLIPPFSWGLLKYQTQFYSYADLWTLFPATSLIAGGGVLALGLAKQHSVRKSVLGHKKYGEPLLILIFATVLCLGGTVSLARENTNRASNDRKIPQAEYEVLESISKIVEMPILVAPDAVLEYARAYSGDIKLVYGRNMWNEALNAYTYDRYDTGEILLHKWMNGSDDVSNAQALESLYQSKATVLILETEKYNKNLQYELEKLSCFKLVDKTEKYVILEKME